ncbi:M13 family metallopeptidase [bacterium]|nr:MAG: M13 family metallopeptidase [bacterium]
MNRIFTLLAVIAMTLIACWPSVKQADLNDPLVANRDTTVAPGQNFFYYANGGWIKNNPIPSSESSNGIWLTIQDGVKDAVKEICETSAKASAPKGSNKQKIGDFFSSGMDTLMIEQMDLKPLESEFQKIDAITDIPGLLRTVAHLQTLQVGAMFSIYVNRDDKVPAQYAIFLNQGGLGLPNRDYYFNTDARTANIRSEYLKHLQAMFQMLQKLGDLSSADKLSNDIVTLETALAKSSRKLEDLRDPYKNYNKMTIAELNKLTPSIDWNILLKEMGVTKLDTVVVGQPEFFKTLNDNVKAVGIDKWKTYLRWNLINTYSAYVSRRFDDQDFDFYSRTIYGIQEPKPRWKRVVEKTNRSLGEVIGQEYVANYLPKGTKEKLIEIGNNIRDETRERIMRLDWMTEPTRQMALKKIETLVMKVGYPDKWKDYSELEVSRDSYAQNVMNAHKWSFNYMIRKYGNPVDRHEWNMFPQTYNAYYDPTGNEIVVPGCNIIVPGYGKKLPDDAVLYGIIGGSTFGHEIIHGFDDQGSQYDETGRLNNWWTKEDREKFEARTKLLIEQYNNYVVLDSLYVRGEATLGENIADLGGIQLGYSAFKKTAQGKSNETLNGLTADQRYFLGFAYAWMMQYRNESLAAQIMTDVHSPVQFRVIGPMSNTPEFYRAFNIQPGEPMYRDEKIRVSLW